MLQPGYVGQSTIKEAVQLNLRVAAAITLILSLLAGGLAEATSALQSNNQIQTLNRERERERESESEKETHTQMTYTAYIRIIGGTLRFVT